MAQQTEQTISVPEAGRRYFGLSSKASYAASAAGTIPTLRVGRLLRVPVRALEKMLDNVPVKKRRRARPGRKPAAANNEARP